MFHRSPFKKVIIYFTLNILCFLTIQASSFSKEKIGSSSSTSSERISTLISTTKVSNTSTIESPLDFKEGEPNKEKVNFKQLSLQPSTTALSIEGEQEGIIEIDSLSKQRLGELLVPADGNCLYTSVILLSLLPVTENENLFKNKLKDLTGQDYLMGLERKTLMKKATSLRYLRHNIGFKTLIKKFLSNMKVQKSVWGGATEIKKIVNKLNVKIQEYIPDPNQPLNLIKSDLTKPIRKKTNTVFHIIRDNPLPEEAFNDKENVFVQLAQLESAKVSQHQQHYRPIYGHIVPESKINLKYEEEEEKKDENDVDSTPLLEKNSWNNNSIFTNPKCTKFISNPHSFFENKNKEVEILNNSKQPRIKGDIIRSNITLTLREAIKDKNVTIQTLLPLYFKETKNNFSSLKKKSGAILFIGKTGAGKSTTINALLDIPFFVKENGRITPTNNMGPKIGENPINSETLCAKPFLDNETNLIFCDLAGSFDTRNKSKALDVCNALAIRGLIENLGSVKAIVLVMEYSNLKSDKATNFTKMFSLLSTMIKKEGLQNLASSLFIVLTKPVIEIDLRTRNYKTPTTKDALQLLKETQKYRQENIKNNDSTPEEENVFYLLNALFPSLLSMWGIREIRRHSDTPLFVIDSSTLLKKGAVRKMMLNSLQKSKHIPKKHINLLLSSEDEEKIEDWLIEEGKKIIFKLDDISRTTKSILLYEKNLTIIKKEIEKKQKSQKTLCDPNIKHQILQEKKRAVKELEQAIYKNNFTLRDFSNSFDKKRKEIEQLEKKKEPFDKDEEVFYKKIDSIKQENGNYLYEYKGDSFLSAKIYGNKSLEEFEEGDKIEEDWFILHKKNNINKEKGICNIEVKRKHTVFSHFAGGFLSAVTLGVMAPFIIYGWHFSAPRSLKIYTEKRIKHKEDINILENQITEIKKEMIETNKKDIRLVNENNDKREEIRTIEKANSNEEQIVIIKNQLFKLDKKKKEHEKNLKEKKNTLTEIQQFLKEKMAIPQIIKETAPFISFPEKIVTSCQEYSMMTLKHCMKCTFHNKISATVCEQCFTPL